MVRAFQKLRKARNRHMRGWGKRDVWHYSIRYFSYLEETKKRDFIEDGAGVATKKYSRR